MSAVYEMDEMGAHSDDGTVWLPRSQFTRPQARTHFVAQFADSCAWVDAKILARYMRHAPDDPGAGEFDGAYWIECDRNTPGAFPVWRCE